MSFAVTSPPGASGPRPILGRDHELRWLTAGLRTAQRGAGAVIVVEGQPGMGKSCILREALQRATDMDMTVLATRALDGEEGQPRAVVRRLFAAAGVDPRISPHELAPLLGRLVRQRPVLVAIDDADRCDRDSLRALAALMLAVDHSAAVALLMTRHYDAPWCTEPAALDALAADPGAIRLRLGPLGPAETTALLDAGVGATPEAAFAAAAHRLTAGNPFLISELALTLGERGIPPVDACAQELEQLAVPGVARRMRGRANLCGTDAHMLLGALSVLGDDATCAGAAALTRAGYSATVQRCRELVAAGLLATEDPPRLAAPMLRSAMYEALPASERLRLHAEAARTLAAGGAPIEAIARHLVAAAPAGDQWAAQFLRRAARSARARGALPQACGYLRRALREDVDALGAELERDLGLALADQGDPGAPEQLQRAFELAGSPRARGELGLVLARLSASTGAVACARSWCFLALDQLRGADERELSARLAAELAALSGPDRARSPWVTLPRGWVTAGGDPSGCLGLALQADLALRAGRPCEHVVELARRAVTGARAWREPRTLIPHLAVEALVAADRLEEANAAWDTGLVVKEQLGAPWDAAAIRAHRAGTRLRLGAVNEAMRDARIALEHVGDAAGPVRARACANLAAALLEAGDLDTAGEVLNGIRCSDDASDPQVALASARLCLARQRPADGLIELEEAARLGIGNPGLLPWRSVAAECHVALGARDRARELASEELTAARGFGAPAAQARALRALALTADPEAAAVSLRQAVRLLEDSASRLELAHTLVSLGIAVSAGDDAGTARDLLRRGMAIAHHSGAAALATRARDALVAAGGRPRRPIHSGRDALTRAERSVAELAAAGHTNREIGGELFITLNTVSTHLRSVYRKLDISCRAQLPEQLTPATAGG